MREYPLMFTTEHIARVIIVSPEVAENWLRFNTNNRSINKKRINEYVGKLNRGLWEFNGETITFNTDGELTNGQHRLTACAQSGVPIETAVVWGCAPGSIITVDRGRSRTLRDNLAIVRDESSNELAAVLNNCVAWFDWGIHSEKAIRRSRGVEHEDAIAFLDANPAIRLFDLYGARSIRKIAPQSVLWFSHFVCAQIDRDDADYFFSHLVNGRNDGSDRDVTVSGLRDKLMGIREDGNRDSVYIMGLIFWTWNKFRSGEVPKRISWSTSNGFPVPA